MRERESDEFLRIKKSLNWSMKMLVEEISSSKLEIRGERSLCLCEKKREIEK